jgi:hypothetical protein
MLKLQMHNMDYNGGDTSIINSNYLQIGGRDYLVGLNNLIGFGYQSSNSGNAYLSAAYIGFTHTEDSGGHDNGDLIFLTRPLGSASTVIPSERMRITASGNVGIGTTAPLTKLHLSSGTFTNDGTGSVTKNWALCFTTLGVMGHCGIVNVTDGSCTCTTP